MYRFVEVLAVIVLFGRWPFSFWAYRWRGAASSGRTRRESVRGGSVAASMPPHGPAPGRDTALPISLPLIGKQYLL
ncbi:hypothetical protein E1J24_09910 [Xanthomonas hortorum pv. pelargonii]|uniref:Uncharacterized protein n=1 Tax=Xanthomonas hortorum pv. pelargonii TaxID=453602 RepID=A0AAW9ZS94_9XANT|nr:hypothetical protein [Xanthomonas hortorum pv. pelargonii]